MKHNLNNKDFKFDSRAKKYDEYFEGKLSEKFYNLVTENVILHKNDRVLDVGCGTGTILKRLSEKYAVECCGIDVEDEMLKVARKKCPNIDFRNCSCDNMPFEDAYFNVIIACMSYHHFPNKEKFIEEAARVIKTGGRIYIADPKFPLPIRKALNTAFSLHHVTGEFFTADELNYYFSEQGFSMVNTLSNSYAQMIILEKI